MTTKNLAIIWILVGLLEVWFGIHMYQSYSKPMFFFMITPEEFAIKNISFGIISMVTGIGIYTKSKTVHKYLALIPFSLILFILIGTLRVIITQSRFDLKYFLIIDYCYIFLCLITFKKVTLNLDEHSLAPLTKNIIKDNSLKLSLLGILLNLLIFTLAVYCPYQMYKY